jgi:cyclic-di-GMP phosphodiesterase, flagellum assembly factor TipF
MVIHVQVALGVAVIKSDRALGLLAAASAIMGIGAVLVLAFTGADVKALIAAGAAAIGIAGLAALGIMQMRRLADAQAATDTLKQHMATLARLVRERNDLPPLAAASPGAEAPRPVAAADLSALADLEALGRIVADLAETVAGQEDRLAEQALRLEALGAPAAHRRSPEAVKAAQLANEMIGLRTEMEADTPAAIAEVQLPPPPPRPALPDPVLANRVKSALQSNRLDLYLRPMVSLPQRKTRYYEATIGIEHDGIVFSGQALSALSRRMGVARQRDVAAIARLIRVARYLRSQDRKVPVLLELCDVQTISERMFATLVEAMRAETDIAKMMMIGLPQAQIGSIRPVEAEVLKAFREAGGRLALSEMSDLAVKPEALASMGVRLAQVSAASLLEAVEAGVAINDVHAQDLPGLFLRRGVEFVLRGVESERQLTDLAESGLTTAQGPLFGDWRLVRDDLIEAPPAAAMQDNTAPDAAAKPSAATAQSAEQRPSFRSLLRRA